MSKLKLVMATTADGVTALGPDDPMDWTGSDDKRAFRLLTSVGGVLGAGRRTFERLPVLKGRVVRCLSTRKGYVNNAEARIALEAGPVLGEMKVSDAAYVQTITLGSFAHQHPDGWLIGGQTVALEALAIGLIGEVFMCRSPMSVNDMVPHMRTGDTFWPQRDQITPRLRHNEAWKQTDTCRIGDTVIEVWRRRP